MLLDGNTFVMMASQGASELKNNCKVINDLNVFPIPDGDTGDNMLMTIESGCHAARDRSDMNTSLSDVAQTMSSGMLLGARGNSGVILSRIFAGISKGLDKVSKATVSDFAHAMNCGVNEAYNAVSEPVEGTILTVLKDAVKVANASHSDDIINYFNALLPEMEQSLERTPDLLPVLHDAGVVDSGGAGLLCIFRGMYQVLQGNVSEKDISDKSGEEKKMPSVNLDAFTSDSELLYGYCTEFLLRLQKSKVNLDTFEVSEIIDYLNAVGESVVAFRDGSIVKVHVHTKTPGDILSHCQRWGEFLTIKIENMTLQHHETTTRNAFTKQRKPYGIVTVAMGKGLEDAFKEAGADCVISGGQTMNPSAQSFIEAFDSLDAETIFVFPNNSNIILTAQQAGELYKKSKIIVLPSKTMGEGYVAIASLDTSSKDTEAIVASTKEVISNVFCGMITSATRNSSINGLDIEKDDYLGLFKGDIVSNAKKMTDATMQLCAKMDVANHDVVLIFSGEDAKESDSEEIISNLQRIYPRTEFILNNGSQPIYNYIIILC